MIKLGLDPRTAALLTNAERKLPERPSAPTKPVIKPDELSTGKGSALTRQMLKATGAPAPAPSALSDKPSGGMRLNALMASIKSGTATTFNAVAAHVSAGVDGPTSASAAAADAATVNEAAKKGPAAAKKALDALLAAHPGDTTYAGNLISRTRAALTETVKQGAKTDPVASAGILDTVTSNIPEGADRDAYVAQVAPFVTEITKGLSKISDNHGGDGPNPGGLTDALTSLQHLSAAAGAKGSVVTDAIAAGITSRDPFYDGLGPTPGFRQALQDLIGKDPQGGGAFGTLLATSLENAGKSGDAGDVRTLVEQSLQAGLEDAQSNYDTAKEKVDTLNANLAEDLSRLGPGATEEQKKAFLDQYHLDHADEYAAEEKAAAALAKTLDALGPTLLGSRNQSLQREALAAAQTLAGTAAGADAALNFIDEVKANPDSELAKGLGQIPDLDKQLQDIGVAAIPNLYAEQLKEHGGSPEQAAAAVENRLKSAEGLNQLFENGSAVIGSALKAIKSGHLDDLLDLPEGPLSKAFLAAGVVIGIAGLGDAKDLPQFLEKVSRTVTDGLELIAQATKDLSGALKGAGELAEKYAPGFGVLAGFLASSEDLKRLIEGGNAGTVVTLLGDATATLGSALAFTPAGPLLAAVGTIVAVIGSAIESSLSEDDRIKETYDTLVRSGVKPETAKILAYSDPDALKTLGKAGLSPEEIQKVLLAAPAIASSESAADVFIQLTKAGKLEPGEIEGFAQALAKSGDFEVALEQYARTEQDFGLTDAKRTDRLLTLLENEFPDAEAFVKAKSPELFTQDGQAQQSANLDYESSWSDGGDKTLQQANDLRDHVSDPAYLAQYIQRIVTDPRTGQAGLLDSVGWMAQDVGLKVVKQALDAALKAGAITRAQYEEAVATAGQAAR